MPGTVRANADDTHPVNDYSRAQTESGARIGGDGQHTSWAVAGRIFALVPLRGAPGSVSLKCDPEFAIDLRGRYDGITPGYHLNKRHWNTVTLDGSVPGDEVLELIGHSYDLVVARLTRAQRSQPTLEVP